ncbi:MAG: hypothetical protein LBR28_04870 [Bacteroidales bacterium]|jgi:hypothetical protein|nr:hypothetical protein [Bacteroidales bacterium]
MENAENPEKSRQIFNIYVMKKLVLIFSVFGALTFCACSSKVDCACTVKTIMTEEGVDQILQTMTYPINDYEGECSNINATKLGLPALTIPSVDVSMRYDVDCTEK